MPVQGVPRVPFPCVQVGPAASVMGLEGVIVGRATPSVVSQETLKRRQRQVPSFVGQPSRLRVRGRQPKPRPARQGSGPPLPSSTARGKGDARLHGPPLRASRLVTKLTKRPLKARVVGYAKTPLRDGAPVPAAPVVALGDVVTPATSPVFVAGPEARRVLSTREASQVARHGKMAAAGPRPVGPSSAELPA